MAKYIDVLPLEEAQSRFLAAFAERSGPMDEELAEPRHALGRVTSRAVYAAMSSPHYYACAMDGVALSASLTFGATETTPVELEPSQYTAVDTGDPLPEGCDAVVMIEDVVTLSGGRIRLLAAVAPWQHVRQIGEDIVAGEMILPSYTAVTPYAIGALYAGGVLRVPVLKKPVFGIIPTGDEVITPTDNPPQGAVIEYNSAIFSAMLAEWGADARVYPIARDNTPVLRAALGKALDECDAVLMLAGSSAGRDDYTSRVIAEMGEVLVHGIAIRPGKPAVLGFARGKPVVGIPGYPVSGVIIMQSFVKPLCNRMLGLRDTPDALLGAALSRNIVSSLKYHEFIRVRLAAGASGFSAVPLERGAGVITSLVKADGFVHIPRDADMALAGEEVRVHLTRPSGAFSRVLSVIGSHDPLIDELADLLIRSRGPAVSSMHVGSIGGIMAVKRGEADVAGIHLLDENTGEYNRAYAARYFPSGGAVLIRGVKRRQGIMTAKGNPHNIRDVKDIFEKHLPYVNRQKGSGTRILLDYLLRRGGIAVGGIAGYEREEMTHMAVAAQIKSGSAQAGLGIYAAAKAMDLDFVFLCDEQYDFLIPADRLETETSRAFIEALRSEAFAERLKRLGGYALDGPGERITYQTI